MSSLLNDTKREKCFFEMDEINFTLFQSNNGMGWCEQQYSFVMINAEQYKSLWRVNLASCKSALNPRWFALPTVLRRWSRC